MNLDQRRRVERALRHNEKLLTRWLTKKLGDPEAAQDVAQTVCMRVLAYSETIGIANPRALIFKTGANLALNELKRRNQYNKRHVEPAAFAEEDPLLQIASSAPSPEAQASLREDVTRVLDAVAALPENPRRAFTMSRFDGLSYKEIARILNVSESSVEKYMIQALKALRKALKGQRDGGSGL